MPRILIADDSAFQRQVIKGIVSSANYQVAGEAVNGKQAVELYVKLAPNLVTMDMTMPELNGIDALKAIKALDPKAKVLMVTAMGYQEYVIECLQLGASGFVVKPFTKEQLLDQIKACLS
ncbi:MAG: response regulator [Bacillota bacterium]|nr:response regulator [Bacillota bacterium]